MHGRCLREYIEVQLPSSVRVRIAFLTARTTRRNRMVFRLGDLPAELRLLVGSAMGADATVGDWMRLEEAGAVSKEGFLGLFTEWLGKQPAGSRFGLCEGTDADLAFVRRHVQGM